MNGIFQNFLVDKQQELLRRIGERYQEKIDDDNVNEKENKIRCYNPITSRRCGWPPNRYLSKGESMKQKKIKVNYAIRRWRTYEIKKWMI